MGGWGMRDGFARFLFAYSFDLCYSDGVVVVVEEW